MIAIILFAIAFWLEGIMDRYYEVYKLNLINWKGIEKVNSNFWSYNPLAPIKGLFGMGRDGWHLLKGWMYFLFFLAASTIALEIHFLDFIPWYTYCFIGPALILTRGIFFSMSLSRARNRITAE